MTEYKEGRWWKVEYAYYAAGGRRHLTWSKVQAESKEQALYLVRNTGRSGDWSTMKVTEIPCPSEGIT